MSALWHRPALPALLALLACADAAALEWRSAPGARDLEFIASFEGADAPGRFREFEVRMNFDPDDLISAWLEVRVEVGSADMGSPELNAAITESPWFDTAAFPQAWFRSHQVTIQADGSYLAEGSLHLKGRERTIAVPFTWQDQGTGAQMEGALELARLDFDIGTGEWAADSTIGKTVLVRFSISMRPQQ